MRWLENILTEKVLRTPLALRKVESIYELAVTTSKEVDNTISAYALATSQSFFLSIPLSSMFIFMFLNILRIVFDERGSGFQIAIKACTHNFRLFNGKGERKVG